MKLRDILIVTIAVDTTILHTTFSDFIFFSPWISPFILRSSLTALPPRPRFYFDHCRFDRSIVFRLLINFSRKNWNYDL
jgi:hypothetical protein